jgi:hypothetical protein
LRRQHELRNAATPQRRNAPTPQLRLSSFPVPDRSRTSDATPPHRVTATVSWQFDTQAVYLHYGEFTLPSIRRPSELAPNTTRFGENEPKKDSPEPSIDSPLKRPALSSSCLRTREHIPGLRDIQNVAGAAVLADNTDILQDQVVLAARQNLLSRQKLPEGTDRFPSLGKAKLDSVRQFDSVANEDRLNPTHANQVYAKIVKAHSLLRTLFNQFPALKNDIKYWDALMFVGEINNRMKKHSGLPEATVDVTLLSNSRKLSGGIRRLGADAGGGFEITFTPKSRTEYFWTTAAHETIHVSQYNRNAKALEEQNLQAFSPNEPLIGFQGHPREKMLQLAGSLPKKLNAVAVDPSSEAFIDIYTALPWELQALLEDTEALRLIEDELHSQSLTSKFIEKDSGLEKLAPLFVQAAKKLGGDRIDKFMSSLFYGKDAFIFAEKSGKAFDHIEKIMVEVEALHSAMNSSGWNAGHGELLRKSMNELSNNLIARGKHFSAETQLNLISAGLQSINDRLKTSPEASQLRLPKTVTYPGEFEAGKTGAIAMLADVLHAQFPKETDSPAVAGLDGASLGKILLSAKTESGFTEKVASLKDRLANDETFSASELKNVLIEAVGCLASTLSGVKKLPMPALHIFDASPTFDHVPGMNLGGDQKRKIEFNPITWQFHVPVDQLAQPARLEARLSRMASRLAWASTAVMLQPLYTSPDFTDTYRYIRKERSMGAVNSLARGFINPVKNKLRRCAAEAKSHVRNDPLCAAALVHHAVRATPDFTEHLAWHRGLRNSVKPHKAEQPAAKAVYDARTHERNRLLPVAIERALKVDAAEMV